MRCNYCSDESAVSVLTPYGKEPLCSVHRKGIFSVDATEHETAVKVAVEPPKPMRTIHRVVQVKELSPAKWLARDLTYKTRQAYSTAEEALMAIIEHDENWHDNGVSLVSKVVWAPKSAAGKAAVKYLKKVMVK